ncbi:MAG: hypothetical protein ABJL67_03590 [Sulfitobacter sp.]
MSQTKILTATLLLSALAACGGNDLTVRDGPQAVHPSTSFLANGTFVPVEGQTVAATGTPCSYHDHHQCNQTHGHGGHGHDGSTPIID